MIRIRLASVASVAVLLGGFLAVPHQGGAASIAQIDDFQDGTTQGWITGGPNPNPPFNDDGGPLGAGDLFLRLSANGVGGAGSKLAVFNGSQWTGDFLGAGISQIKADVNNFGPNDLELRLILEGAGGNFISASGTPVTAGSGWQSVTFLLTPGELTGGADVNATLGGVTNLWIQHNLGTVSQPGTAPVIEAELGIDNILAVPEPGTLGLAALALLALLTATRRRQ